MNSMLIGTGDPLSHVVQHPIVTKVATWAPGGTITLLSDHIVMMAAAALLLMIFLPLVVRRKQGTGEVDRLVPRGMGTLVESICAYLRDEVARPAIGPHTDRFIKFIWTVFFFILTMNLLGLVPLGSWSPLAGLHIGGTPTANIWITGTLAVITLVIMVFYGLKIGGLEYLKHFNPGAPMWIAPLIVVLEVISTLARIFALAIRLFAAIAGGHILLAVLVGLILTAGQAMGMGGGLGIGLVVVTGSVAISLVEVFVAFLQAFIFTYLSALFIGMSVNLHHDHVVHIDDDAPDATAVQR